MCWCTEKAACGKMKVAEKDIKTFKIVIRSWISQNQLISFFANFRYTVGEAYKTEIGKPYTSECRERNIICIQEGFHSYSDYKGKIKIENIDSKYNLIRIKYDNKTSDSYALPASFLYRYDYRRINCIIPKGARYYLNEDGIYVSDQIKVVSWEELPQVTNE